MSGVALLGYLAGFLTTVALVPQVIKTWKTKSADDFSLVMLVTWWAGVVCWIVYGVIMNAGPLIVWNTITLFLAGAILTMKLKFNNRNEKEPAHAPVPVVNKKPEVKGLKDWGVV